MQLLDVQLSGKDFRSWIKDMKNEHVLETESLFYSKTIKALFWEGKKSQLTWDSICLNLEETKPMLLD